MPHHSPRYQSMKRDGNKVELTFSHVGQGLQTFDTRSARGFAVAGPDKRFYWAKGEVVGKDKIVVTCDDVAAPVAVRYGWADNPVCNVYTREGLPLTPFRTDDWPGETVDAK
ncbi:MAG: hypothetical protein U0835_15810 [Isosphaeraceae bacterium]